MQLTDSPYLSAVLSYALVFAQPAIAVTLDAWALSWSPSNVAAIRVDSNLVLVPIAVTDNRNRLFPALQIGSFRVFEDGIEQQVSSVSSGDVPISVGVVFDTSASMKTKLEMARRAVTQFLKTTNPEDEFFFLPFDSSAGPMSTFTHDPEVILYQVGSTEARGSTALLDAISTGLGKLRQGHNPRRAMLIVSDGEDNHSRYTKSEIKAMIREANVQIYAMAIRQQILSRRGRPVSEGPELLKQICNETGGRSFEIEGERDLLAAADRIGLELRNEYLLAYRPTNQQWDGRYRHVTVKLIETHGMPHLRAYWRRGYRAPTE
jgi:Ca-activated chloride channel family protein